jgi:alanine dehydrogenase
MSTPFSLASHEEELMCEGAFVRSEGGDVLSQKWSVFLTDDIAKMKELLEQDWEYVMTFKDQALFRKLRAS